MTPHGPDCPWTPAGPSRRHLAALLLACAALAVAVVVVGGWA